MNHLYVPKYLPPRARLMARLAVICGLTTLFAAQANAQLISLADLNAGLSRAAATLIADRAACEKLVDTPRDVCREQARAKEMVTRAELEHARTGTRKSQDYLSAVKRDTAYDVARAQCNDKSGDLKSLCTRQAQAARDAAKATLKRQQLGTDDNQASKTGTVAPGLTPSAAPETARPTKP